MKYFITGITGMRNRGVEALVVSTLETIQAMDPKAWFTLLSVDSQYDGSLSLVTTENGRIIQHSHDYFSPARFASRRWLETRLGARGKKEKAILTAMEEADVVLASGGDMFASDYGIHSLERHLRLLELALDLGKKVVFFGHSIGPFKTEAELAAWAKIAARCDLITLRESLSYQYVKQHLPSAKPQIVHTADVAFLLKVAAGVGPLMGALGLAQDIPVVACSISGGIVSFSGVNHEKHLDSWVRCITHLVEKEGVQALLVPHVQEISRRNDDRLFATELLRRLTPRTASRVRLAGGELRATEYKALIARCDLLVAERMHAAIAGLSTGVPTLVVGYSVKARGILIDVMGSEENAAAQLISVNDFCNADLALERVLAAWHGRAATKEALDAAKPRLMDAARKNFSCLLEVVQKQS